ncbi:MAG: sigma-70 family RNA polymerase sigma factor [Anaerolineae bacterium]|nr:sigma-70 family RNA polymerase sigma factor [Anaerolineae bacterium]MCB9133388.1 sigma-70 family RNA polymerase sigma factor [Anaerolineales bacterium]MCB0230355.1 sigma-70 family RNA polymerase sigma factor [Anaerolineae bacterium]MCB0233963.1 sigma-70 family RNA polymerase sigma factor [Anaerolineae bacterium]MCB0240309.1 sigma-70 family RNA polymerase sigma factor [Anaerolineae bacterium]
MPGLAIDLNIYPDETALLEALKAGDTHACACMVKHHGNQMYAVALRIVGDSDEAEEVVQEAFISACSKVDSFEGRSKLSTWLYRITTNAALMRLRKQRGDTVSLDEPQLMEEGDLVPRQLGDWQMEPSQEALTTELRQVMDEAVQGLNPTLRAAFVLRDIQGLSTEEAAAALDISESALKVRLHRARLQLRESLADYLAGGKEEARL